MDRFSLYNFKTLVLALGFSVSFLTVGAFADDDDAQRNLDWSSLSDCEAKADKFNLAVACAEDAYEDYMGQTVPSKFENAFALCKEEKLSGDRYRWKLNYSIYSEDEQGVDEGRGRSKKNNPMRALLSELRADGHKQLVSLFNKCRKKGGDLDLEDKDEKQREKFNASCKDTKEEFNTAYRDYKKACAEAGISNCDAHIGECIEAVGSFRNNDQFAFNVFSQAQGVAGSGPSNCPSLNAENFTDIKREYDRIKERSRDREDNITDFEQETLSISNGSVQKIQEMQRALNAAQLQLKQKDEQIEIAYQASKNEAFKQLVEMQKVIEDVTDDQITLRETMQEQRIDMDVAQQERVGECIETAKVEAVAKIQSYYDDRNRRAAGAGNQGGSSRSSSRSATGFFEGSAQNSRQQVQQEYQRQLNICLTGGGFSAAKSGYEARVRNLEANYQARYAQLESKRVQLSRDFETRKKELETQLQAEALKLIQDKEVLIVQIADMNNAINQEQQSVRSVLAQRNTLLQQIRQRQGQENFELQMMEQKYFYAQAAANQVGENVKPGAVLESISSYNQAQAAVQDMIETCNCLACENENIQRLRTSGEELAANCSRAGVSFFSNMADDASDVMCPSGDFSTNPAVRNQGGGRGVSSER